MPLELIMNVTESALYVYLVNSLVPAKDKKKGRICTALFLVISTLLLSLQTYLNLNYIFWITSLLLVKLYIYTSIRNYNLHFKSKLTVTLLASSFTPISTTLAFASISIFLNIPSTDIFKNQRLVIAAFLIGRTVYLILSVTAVRLYKNHLKNVLISKNKLLSSSVIIATYAYTIDFSLTFFLNGTFAKGESIVYQIIFFFGAILIISLFVFYRALIGDQAKSSQILYTSLQDLKMQYDNRERIDFESNIQMLSKLKDEMLSSVTPVVQFVTNCKFNEARILMEEFLQDLDQDLPHMVLVPEHVASHIISLKELQCKKEGISFSCTKHLDRELEHIFQKSQLESLIINLIDLAMMQCDKDDSNCTIHLIMQTKQASLILEMHYKEKEEKILPQSRYCDTIIETILESTLSSMAGFQKRDVQDGMVSHRVVLPYAGRSYVWNADN